MLSKSGWTVAVTPSSGYSTFGGNFATNARGSGTAEDGPFGAGVNRLRPGASSGEDEMHCAVLSMDTADAARLGVTMGNLMKRVAGSCRYYAGEFLFIDAGIVRPDDPIRAGSG